ncbi:hypothetical protein [Parasulfitobacter algicola]|uniref:Uncharacterized protein n=1 Tax=Parasulfitobacter algicola TaxID=2614809 RepID=A0ABX2ILK0_9RHOB|nr:hypothetical protein [Sulfitobacter algicola]NSX53742.1 hypothetical protein [Sulfitobacter algicola]
MVNETADQKLDALIGSINEIRNDWLIRPIDTYNVAIDNAHTFYQDTLARQRNVDQIQAEFVIMTLMVGSVALIGAFAPMSYVLGAAGTMKYMKNMVRMKRFVGSKVYSTAEKFGKNRVAKYIWVGMSAESVSLLKTKGRIGIASQTVGGNSADMQIDTIEDIKLSVRQSVIRTFDKIKQDLGDIRNCDASEAEKMQFYNDAMKSPFIAKKASEVNAAMMANKSKLQDRMKLAFLLHYVMSCDYLKTTTSTVMDTGTYIHVDSDVKKTPIHISPSSPSYPQNKSSGLNSTKVKYRDTGNIVAKDINTLYQQLADDVGYKKEKLMDDDDMFGSTTNKVVLKKAEAALEKLAALDSVEKMLPKVIGF